MSIEFIGYIGGHHASEIHPRSGPTLQPDYVETVARAHEEAGFDRALVAFHSNSPDSTLIAAHAASVTKKLQFLIAHLGKKPALPHFFCLSRSCTAGRGSGV